MAQGPAAELCTLLKDVAAKAVEAAALPLVGDAVTLQATLDAHTAALTQISGTLARLDTTLDVHTAALARLDTTLDAHTAALAQINGTLNAHTAALARLEQRAAVAYNAACGEGVSRQYAPVPNAAGVLPSPQLRAVQTAADFRGLTAAQVIALANFYGVAPSQQVGVRKENLKHVLGLSIP